MIGCDQILDFSCISVLLNEGLRLYLSFYLRIVLFPLRFIFLFKCCISSSTQTGSTTGEPGSVWDGCYKWYQSLVSCC
ncbi:hypothetical protein LINPERHAP1_LOCUS15880, partial [Linum perenne]